MMTGERLLRALPDTHPYEIKSTGRTYQAEVQILKNTDDYIHVAVAVDDGHFFSALRPASDSFIRRIS
jgi:hypothetical protein